jgi:hypothetical protein
VAMNVNQTLRTLALASMLGLSACASNSAPATWEKETLNIEVFATSDISQETINQVEEGLNVAIDLWGNPGPIEYWLIGTDEDAMEALADEYCQRRDDRGDFDKADCLEDTLANRDHGYRSYLEIGQEAVASQQASSNMGRNGHSQWGFHAYTSSIPLGFEGLLGTAPEEDQRGILHEFFHALQHGSFPPNVSRDDADDLMGPIWFVEGGAEYMAQTGLVQAHESGALASFSGGDSGWPGFATQMSWKLSDAQDYQLRCPSLAEIDYSSECSQYAYEGGTWAHALLAKKAGPNALVETFYPQLHELGWAGAFLATYGQTPEEFMQEFDAFLGLSLEEQVAWFPWLG